MVTDKEYYDAQGKMKEARKVADKAFHDYFNAVGRWDDYLTARTNYRHADAELADLEELLGWT